MHPTSKIPSDAALESEAVNQLHDLDDRRDAAEMRVEEFVRDAEYVDEPAPAESPRRPRWIWIGAAIVGAILYALARLLPT